MLKQENEFPSVLGTVELLNIKDPHLSTEHTLQYCFREAALAVTFLLSDSYLHAVA